MVGSKEAEQHRSEVIATAKRSFPSYHQAEEVQRPIKRRVVQSQDELIKRRGPVPSRDRGTAVDRHQQGFLVAASASVPSESSDEPVAVCVDNIGRMPQATFAVSRTF